MENRNNKNFFYIFDSVLKYCLISFVIIFIAVLSIHKIENKDIWFHLKVGQYIVENITMPFYDVFSYTIQGQPWINQSWLSGVFFYLIFNIFGAGGLIIFSTLLLSIALFLLASIGYKKDNFLIVILFLMLTASYTFHMLPIRPLIFAYVFSAIYFFILYNYRLKSKNLIYFLPFFQLIWTNLHASFIIGIAIIFSFIVGDLLMWKLNIIPSDRMINRSHFSKLLIVGFISAIVCFINPYGYKLPMYVFSLLKSKIFMTHLTEWVSIFQYHSVPPIELFYYKIIVGVVITTFLLNIKKLDITNLIIFIGFLFLSLSSRRNVSLFLFLSLPILCINLNDIIEKIITYFRRKKMDTIIHSLKLATQILFIFVVVIQIFRVLTDRFYFDYTFKERQFGLGVMEFPYRYFDEATTFIERNNISGNMFNDLETGNYLVWRFYPKRKVFFDMRVTDYGEDFFGAYKKSLVDSSSWHRLTKKYGINYVFLDYSLPEKQNLLSRLYNDKNWRLIFFNDNAVIFIRNLNKNKEIIKKYSIDFNNLQTSKRQKRFYKEIPFFKKLLKRKEFPYAHFNRGIFFNSIGLYKIAIEEYAKAIELNPDISFIHTNLGTTYYKMGMKKEAVEEFETAINLQHNNSYAYFNLGAIYVNDGSYEEAIGYFKKALMINPKYTQVFFNLGLAYFKIGRYDKSIDYLKKALKCNPDNIYAYYYLGIDYANKGKTEKAIEQWRQALKIDPEFQEARLNIQRLQAFREE